MQKQNCFIIGNAPPQMDLSSAIDSATEVIRFNKCEGLGGLNGTKTTRLYLCNTGRLSKRWQPEDIQRNGIDSKTTIYTPYPKPSFTEKIFFILNGKRGAAIDGTRHIKNLAACSGLSSEEAPPEIYNTTKSALIKITEEHGLKSPSKVWKPSIGAIAISHTLLSLNCKDMNVHIVGFGHYGSKMHHWDAERLFVINTSTQGLNIVIHPTQSHQSTSR